MVKLPARRMYVLTFRSTFMLGCFVYVFIELQCVEFDRVEQNAVLHQLNSATWRRRFVTL